MIITISERRRMLAAMSLLLATSGAYAQTRGNGATIRGGAAVQTTATSRPVVIGAGGVRLEKIVCDDLTAGDSVPGMPVAVRFNNINNIQCTTSGMVVFETGGTEATGRYPYRIGVEGRGTGHGSIDHSIWQYKKGKLTRLIALNHLPGEKDLATIRNCEYAVGADGQTVVAACISATVKDARFRLYFIEPGKEPKAIAESGEHGRIFPAGQIPGNITIARPNVTNDHHVGAVFENVVDRKRSYQYWTWDGQTWTKVRDANRDAPWDGIPFDGQTVNADGEVLYGRPPLNWTRLKDGRTSPIFTLMGQPLADSPGDSPLVILPPACAPDGVYVINMVVGNGGPAEPDPRYPKQIALSGKSGVWIVDASDRPRLIWMREGSPTPIGTPPNLLLGGPHDERLASRGAVAFAVTAAVPDMRRKPDDFDLHEFLFAARPGEVRFVLGEGQRIIPDDPDTQVDRINGFDINSNGQVVVGTAPKMVHTGGRESPLRPDPGGKSSVWSGMPGHLHLLMQSGSSLEIAPGVKRKVESVELAGVNPIGDDGGVFVLVHLERNARAIYKCYPPT